MASGGDITPLRVVRQSLRGKADAIAGGADPQRLFNVCRFEWALLEKRGRSEQAGHVVFKKRAIKAPRATHDSFEIGIWRCRDPAPRDTPCAHWPIFSVVRRGVLGLY